MLKQQNKTATTNSNTWSMALGTSPLISPILQCASIQGCQDLVLMKTKGAEVHVSSRELQQLYVLATDGHNHRILVIMFVSSCGYVKRGERATG